MVRPHACSHVHAFGSPRDLLHKKYAKNQQSRKIPRLTMVYSQPENRRDMTRARSRVGQADRSCAVILPCTRTICKLTLHNERSADNMQHSPVIPEDLGRAGLWLSCQDSQSTGLRARGEDHRSHSSQPEPELRVPPSRTRFNRLHATAIASEASRSVNDYEASYIIRRCDWKPTGSLWVRTVQQYHQNWYTFVAPYH